jgi:hypothetical protein
MKEYQVAIETSLQRDIKFSEKTSPRSAVQVIVNNCTCECERDYSINALAKSETRVNLLVALPRQHAAISWINNSPDSFCDTVVSASNSL